MGVHCAVKPRHCEGGASADTSSKSTRGVGGPLYRMIIYRGHLPELLVSGSSASRGYGSGFGLKVFGGAAAETTAAQSTGDSPAAPGSRATVVIRRVTRVSWSS